MTNRPGTGSYWDSTPNGEPSRYPPLLQDCQADVVIVGAGIVGLTAADVLLRAGKSVVVLEARRVGGQATGRSTAKITSQHGLIYERLIREFGEDKARMYARANQEAIAHIAQRVEDGGIACGFERKTAYMYGETESEIGKIENEARAALHLGLPARLCDGVPAPVVVKKALAFDDQAQFNPVQYLAGLAGIVASAGGRIYEETRAVDVEHSDKRCVRTESGALLRADDVIIATHLPFVPNGLFFSRAYPWAHPMVAAPIDAGCAPDGMFINVGEPGRSFRTDASGGDAYLLAVGGTYKPGNPDEEKRRFEELEDFLLNSFGIASPTFRWTNEDYESMDGMPFVGQATSGSPHLYVATGFNAWGMTNGTAAGLLLADLVCGKGSAYASAFDATRIKPITGGAEFFKENAGVAERFIRGRYLAERPDFVDPKPGHAMIAKIHGEPVAAFRHDDGTLHTVSAICTHLGCVVGWNQADRTWDCPCHGSRFDYDGKVLSGPATAPLRPAFKE